MYKSACGAAGGYAPLGRLTVRGSKRSLDPETGRPGYGDTIHVEVLERVQLFLVEDID
jgi:hypothetical protein